MSTFDDDQNPVDPERGDNAARPARLDVGVLGAGRVGAVLGAALARAGHRVVATSAVSLSSRARAAALIPAAEIVEPRDVLARADLVLVAVPSQVLPGLVEGLAATGAVRPGQLIAHTAGRYGLGVLDPAVAAGALPLAMHPVFSFTGTTVDLRRLADTTFGVAAPEPLWPVVEALVVEMGGEPLRVADEQRAAYHAAISHATHHLMTVLNDAVDLLTEAGIEHPERVLSPLFTAASDHALRRGDAASAGPATEGEAAAIAEHLTTLGRLLPDAVESYRALARRTVDRALDAGRMDASTAEGLLDVLADQPRRRLTDRD